jgi:hypothetical protein
MSQIKRAFPGAFPSTTTSINSGLKNYYPIIRGMQDLFVYIVLQTGPKKRESSTINKLSDISIIFAISPTHPQFFLANN